MPGTIPGLPSLPKVISLSWRGRKRKVCRRHRLMLCDIDAALERAIHMLEKYQVRAVVNDGNVHGPLFPRSLGLARRRHFPARAKLSVGLVSSAIAAEPARTAPAATTTKPFVIEQFSSVFPSMKLCFVSATRHVAEWPASRHRRRSRGQQLADKTGPGPRCQSRGQNANSRVRRFERLGRDS